MKKNCLISILFEKKYIYLKKYNTRYKSEKQNTKLSTKNAAKKTGNALELRLEQGQKVAGKGDIKMIRSSLWYEVKEFRNSVLPPMIIS